MSASLLSFLSPESIEEKIPQGALPQSVKAASIVSYRNRVRYIPTSGATYAVPSGSKIVQFRLTGNDSLDLPTAALHFRFQTSAGNLVQEGIFSIIQRVRLALNSVIVSDTDNAHVAAHTKVLNTMPRQVYQSADGEYLGLYKRSQVLGSTAPPTLATITQTISGYYKGTAAEGSSTGGSSFIVPLSLICSAFGLPTFLPLRNVGNLELTLFLEDPSVCLYGYGGTTVTGGSYTLSDVSLEVDSVQLDNAVTGLMDRLASDVSGSGIVLPVTTDVTQNINYASGSGQKSISISRGTTALTALCMAKRLQSQVGTSANQSLSSFQCFGQSRVQIRLGARLFPQTAADSLARMFTETRHAYGMFNNMVSGGLVTRQNYENNDNDQGAFTYCYNFRRTQNQEMDLDGENSIQAGSIIIADITDNPSGNVTLTAVIESLRYIQLKGSAVQVTGL